MPSTTSLRSECSEPRAQDLSANAILAAAVGADAVIGRTLPCDAAAVVASMGAAIHYAGGAGSHPNPAYLQSQSHAEEAKKVLEHVEAWASSAELLSSIWLKDGHPFYPVFWDFAFLAVHGPDAVVLIGASSD